MDATDLRSGLHPTHAVGSLAVHLTALTGDPVTLRSQTLCGRAVTYLPPVASLLEAGCPECAFQAIAMGARLVQDRDDSAVRLSDVLFES